MVTKLRLAAAVLALCLALTGCMKIENTIEDLMSPPKLSEEQENIFAALYASAGDDISLKYPKTGENRSAFVMKDLDSDGVNEALVFYTSNIMGDNVRINVLDCINGEWVSLYECVGMGPEVESVSFPHMTSAEAGNIVIAYNMLNRKDKVIAVYSYNSERIVEKFSREYSDFVISDMDSDGMDEIFLVNNRYGEDVSEASFIDTSSLGTVMVYATAPLSSEVMQYKKVVIDTTEKGEVYALIDGTLATGSNVTEIIKIAGGSIENFLITDERDFTVRTLRTLDVVSRDIDGDGHYEIPCSKAIPGAPIVGEESSASLVQWHSFTGDDLEGRGYSLVSAEFGYIFNYPVEWGNDVTVIQQRDGNEWRFYYFDRSQGESGESTDIEILRLRVYENNDYVDEEITEGYTVVGKNDRFTYYLYLPQQTPDNSAPLSITEESFAEHFEF